MKKKLGLPTTQLKKSTENNCQNLSFSISLKTHPLKSQEDILLCCAITSPPVPTSHLFWRSDLGELVWLEARDTCVLVTWCLGLDWEQSLGRALAPLGTRPASNSLQLQHPASWKLFWQQLLIFASSESFCHSWEESHIHTLRFPKLTPMGLSGTVSSFWVAQAPLNIHNSQSWDLFTV